MFLLAGSLLFQYSMPLNATYAPQQTSETTWELLETSYPDALFRDVKFINSTYGWVAGELHANNRNDIIVLHTCDGGDSWQLQYNHSLQSLTMMDVLDDHTIWINGYGALFYSPDAGKTWNESTKSGWFGMSTVEFVNHTYGWTATGNTLYRTTDGGQSWQSVPGWNYTDSPRMIEVLSPLNIWAVGFDGIYHSTDGGETWAESSHAGGWAISFVSETDGWVIGDNRLAHTTDGVSWDELIVPMRAPAFRLRAPYTTDIKFIDEDHGWIVGTEISVMYTPNGGADWYEQSVPSRVNSQDLRLMAVDFIDQTQGWAVGTSGVIMRTTTGSSLGPRLWYGISDPLFVSIVGIVAVGIVVSAAGARFLRSRRGEKTSQTLL